MKHPIRLLSIFDNDETPLKDRVEAAHQIATWGRGMDLAQGDLARLYGRLFDFWQNLGSPRQGDQTFFRQRVRVGRACSVASSRLKDGPRLYKYYPPLGDVEGPNRSQKGKIARGRLSHTYTSIYEFHFENPIEGFGTQKDLISVVEEDGTRTQLFDWCRQHEVFVFCGRCGLDITYEVSRDCPWRKFLRS